MLARSFMTADQLGIPERERDALVRVLHMMERGEIGEDLFHMGQIGFECGTPACILGWARRVLDDISAFRPIQQRAPALRNLFLMGSDHPTIAAISRWQFDYKNQEQAAMALSNYLTTGDPNWAQALSVI